MRPDLDALVRQREELDRQIAQTEQDAAEAYVDALESIESTLRAWADSAGQVIAETRRKNVTSLHINGVHVELGYPAEQWAAQFSIRWGSGNSASFDGDLPPAAAVVQFVKELLLAYPDTESEGDAR